MKNFKKYFSYTEYYYIREIFLEDRMLKQTKNRYIKMWKIYLSN